MTICAVNGRINSIATLANSLPPRMLDPIAPLVRSVCCHLPEETPILEATDALLKLDAPSVWLHAADGRFTGCVPDYELLKAHLTGAELDGPVSQLAHYPAVTLAPQMRVTEAAMWFREGRYRQLPVVLHDKLVGILTRGDVLRFLGSADRSLSVSENGLSGKVTTFNENKRDEFLRGPRYFSARTAVEPSR